MLTPILVMCEKPLTPTAAEAEELFKIAKANKRILGVYQNRRWDGDFLTIQKLIKDNTVSTSASILSISKSVLIYISSLFPPSSTSLAHSSISTFNSDYHLHKNSISHL